MIQLDGSQGEGGGQILRTALSLSLCTGQPFRITKIRAGRQKPGLLRQHLTAVTAAEQIGNATVSGAEIGSCELTFSPDKVRPGAYQFAVGTAGSATLVFQAVLPALLTATAESSLICQGGTHNPFAPPFDFLDRCFVPQIRKMGAALELELIRPGFFPAGGGEFRASIKPAGKLTPLSIREHGKLIGRHATIYLANLSPTISDREHECLKERFPWAETSFTSASFPNSPGPGNAVLLEEIHEHVTEIATGFGEKGVTAENVVRKVTDDFRNYQVSGAVVGKYLADQLLVPFALAGSGEFVTTRPTNHSLTNAKTIEVFLNVSFRFTEISKPIWQCSLS